MGTVRSYPVTWANLQRLAEAGHLFAVLDACDEPDTVRKVLALPRERCSCLIPGTLDEDEQEVAPYLVQADAPLLEWLRSTVCSRPWGIFVAFDGGFRPLRRHLRRFLTVEGPKGEPLYFRFYDPRVLPPFIDTCSPQQVQELFGPLLGLGVPSPGSAPAKMFVKLA